MKFTKTLEEDIESQINAGFTKQEIRTNLLMKGISEEEINRTFEQTNFQRAPANRQNGVSYKSITFTIILILISMFKVVRCISEDRHEPTAFEQNNLNLPVANYQEQRSARISTIIGEKLMYKNYDELVNSEIPNEKYKIIKFTKDTALYVDLKTKLSIKKGTFYYNNHSERLRMALKADDNVNIFIYDFEGKGNLLAEFKASKAIGGYKYLSSKKERNLTTIKYNYIVDNISYSGCAFAMEERKNYFYFAFESNNLTQKALKVAGLSFLTKRLVNL